MRKGRMAWPNLEFLTTNLDSHIYNKKPIEDLEQESQKVKEYDPLIWQWEGHQ